MRCYHYARCHLAIPLRKALAVTVGVNGELEYDSTMFGQSQRSPAANSGPFVRPGNYSPDTCSAKLL